VHVYRCFPFLFFIKEKGIAVHTHNVVPYSLPAVQKIAYRRGATEQPTDQPAGDDGRRGAMRDEREDRPGRTALSRKIRQDSATGPSCGEPRDVASRLESAPRISSRSAFLPATGRRGEQPCWPSPPTRIIPSRIAEHLPFHLARVSNAGRRPSRSRQAIPRRTSSSLTLPSRDEMSAIGGASKPRSIFLSFSLSLSLSLPDRRRSFDANNANVATKGSAPSATGVYERGRDGGKKVAG
jgi:hypothetical protein